MSDAIEYCPKCETHVMCHMERSCQMQPRSLDAAVGLAYSLRRVNVAVPHQPSWNGVLVAESDDGICWPVRRPGCPEKCYVHKNYVTLLSNVKDEPCAPKKDIL